LTCHAITSLARPPAGGSQLATGLHLDHDTTVMRWPHQVTIRSVGLPIGRVASAEAAAASSKRAP
jgi:hypothetical protein